MAVFRNLLKKNSVDGSRIARPDKIISSFEWFIRKATGLFGADRSTTIDTTRNTIRDTTRNTDVEFPQLDNSVNEGIFSRMAKSRKTPKPDKGKPSVTTFVPPQLVIPGNMYMYYYLPKWKKKLKYWDAFPMIIGLSQKENGWLGLNMHYLSPYRRARYMDILHIRSDNYMAAIRYEAIKDLRETKHCIKRYLTDHVTSRIILIDESEWHKALFMPVENFQKAPKTTVWADV